MTNKQYQTLATEELKEAVAVTASEAIEGLGLIDLTTAATPADIIDTLFMKIIDGELYTPKYNFILTSILPKELVRLGNKEYKYSELEGTSDQLALTADNTMEDFNGEYVPEYAEVYQLDDDFHKKVKLPELVLSNAWVAAEQMVEFVQIQVEEMKYAIERRWENKAWTLAFAEAEEISVGDGVEAPTAIEFVKAIQSQMVEYKTTSNTHNGIGTGGVVSINTVSGVKTIQPDLYFDTNEFVIIVDKDQFVDTQIDYNAQWFNYNATQIENLEMKVLSFEKYSGFRAILDGTGAEIKPAVTVPAGLKFVVIHREALRLLEQYNYSETLKGRGPWSINHNHSKLGNYRVKTKPVLTFVEAPVSPVREAKKEVK